MAAKKRHVVTATMIVVKVPGAQGGETYLRRGRLLPESVEAKEIKRLTELGLIGVAPEPEGEPGAQASTGGSSTSGSGSDSGAGSGDGSGPTSK